MDKYGKYGTVRQREEYGGVNIGASFFGWLVAIGIGALLTALLSAAGTAIAISEIDGDEAASAVDTVGIVGGILILAVALIAYFAGGYVAGRMSRFDGARQGVGVWAWSIVVTAAPGADRRHRRQRVQPVRGPRPAADPDRRGQSHRRAARSCSRSS